MFRVVTKTRRQHKGQWHQVVDAGPWHPEEDQAMRWASYLSSTGMYDVIEVESNVRGPDGNRRYRFMRAWCNLDMADGAVSLDWSGARSGHCPVRSTEEADRIRPKSLSWPR